ncbi:MAG: cytochrome c biogenesis protein CcdA [Deltaproteobacteria bacterium]|jgi:cytochrome c-type biogenesis protein|nr:cytochrome c biogenesis protein CcdA [Deltaproteobacteria bacterium]
MIVLQNVDSLAALVAGLAMFFTPCTLPLLPAWLSTVYGNTATAYLAQNAKVEKTQRLKIIIATLFFVLGFSLVFTLLGLAASSAGEFLLDNRDLLRYLGGAAMIVFGLALLGVISPWKLFGEKHLKLPESPLGMLGAFLVGVAFAAGWTPCSGPVLASILALAATSRSMVKGLELLGLFSLGLAIPFLVLSLLLGKLYPLFKKMGPYTVWVSRFLGVSFIILAILLLFDQLAFITPDYTPKR